MNDRGKNAVFLSYASQDAEAARRICEALRSGGVEVWFDADGGLEHGDEWDQKIRRQIKECVLFIPIISANTQVREEGYFRLEWDLAAERTRTIASGVPFILPVVIDDTREPDALVPDRFRAVQWTRLPLRQAQGGAAGDIPPEVLQRFLKLWSHRTGVLKHEAGVAQASSLPSVSDAGGTPALPRTVGRRVPFDRLRAGPAAAWAAAVLAVALAVGGYFWLKRPAKNAGAGTRPPTMAQADELHGTPGVAGATVSSPAPDSKSVAVLAFDNLSDDKANEYFSDGISEELLNALAKVPGLRVAARTSAFYFKGRHATAQEIGQKLGMAHLVDGTVRKEGTAVRVVAHLSRTDTGEQIWTAAFDGTLDKPWALQEKIAGQIAQALQVKLGATAQAARSVNPEAYGWLLQGRFFARQESNAGWKQSIDFFRQAVGLEPGYAAAWAELAQSYIRLARFGGMMTADGIKEARRAAQKSLELDPDQLIALDAMGWVQRTADWDWRAAQKTFQRALSLAPENSAVLADAAILYFNVGRVDEAVALARQAAERDPLNAMAQFNLADLLMQSGGLAESVEIMNRGIKLAPQVELFRSHLAVALMRLKRFAEADALVEQEPNEAYRLWGRGIIAGLRGDRAAVTQAREALMAKQGSNITGSVAMLYIAEGNHDEAFAWLERSFVERDSTVCWVKTALYYEPLRNDARWPVFLRKLGLADDQLK